MEVVDVVAEQANAGEGDEQRQQQAASLPLPSIIGRVMFFLS